MRLKHLKTLAAAAALAVGLGQTAVHAQAVEKEMVIATVGGSFEQALIQYFYTPFEKAAGTTVVPVAVEMPDQWARARAMSQSGKMEFDIVTATAPDLIQNREILAKIDCAALPDIAKNGVKGACTEYGVIRTIGGMVLAYNTKALGDKQPAGWKDFFDVQNFPGPRSLPDTGDRAWWVPVAAMAADGGAADKMFPLDLDRAYKKLDQIKPHIAVWWKSGGQIQQILRNNEAVMVMSYSGRAVQLVNEGLPISLTWGQAIPDIGYMAVMKQAPHPKAAMAYLDFFYKNAAENHLGFVQKVFYDTGSAQVAPLVTPERRKLMATVPENWDAQLKPDYAWIGANRDMLRERWVAWLTK